MRFQTVQLCSADFNTVRRAFKGNENRSSNSFKIRNVLGTEIPCYLFYFWGEIINFSFEFSKDKIH